ncbi:MAG TPA: FMN-binding negative transcriptional regulator [Puia sp.]|nr:FMN-binding negative transcriptional regulator [Puia sp.]
MYIPGRYEEKDPGKIHAFIRENSFAILVTVMEGVPIATHIPLLLEKDGQGRDVLVGHISRGNDQKLSFADDTKVLAIFPGPHAYVSPRWYTRINVPTWNYIAVHVYGTLTVMGGEELKAALSRLVDNYEHRLPTPVKIGEIPDKQLAAELRGIVGFRILVTEMQAAYKLSQNRDEGSYHEVIRQLETGDEAARAVAGEMRDREQELFSSKKPPEK